MPVVLACACFAASVLAPPRSASAATPRARIDALMRSAIAHHGIRAAILQVTVNGRTLITKAYGT